MAKNIIYLSVMSNFLHLNIFPNSGLFVVTAILTRARIPRTLLLADRRICITALNPPAASVAAASILAASAAPAKTLVALPPAPL